MRETDNLPWNEYKIYSQKTLFHFELAVNKSQIQRIKNNLVSRWTLQIQTFVENPFNLRF